MVTMPSIFHPPQPEYDAGFYDYTVLIQKKIDKTAHSDYSGQYDQIYSQEYSNNE